MMGTLVKAVKTTMSTFLTEGTRLPSRSEDKTQDIRSKKAPFADKFYLSILSYFEYNFVN